MSITGISITKSNKGISNSDKVEKIISFIRDKNEELGTEGAVIGLSGGLDSTVCAYLLVKSLGKENVVGIAIPAPNSDQIDLACATLVAEELGIRLYTHDLKPLLFNEQDMTKQDYLSYRKIAEEYFMTPNQIVPRTIEAPFVRRLRGRAFILSFYAYIKNYFQCQTLERTEWMLGWFDKFGDGIGDIAPIFHLWKSEVRQIGEYLKIPKIVLDRPPSSGNYQMTDEEELGMSLAEADSILRSIIEFEPIDLEIPIEKRNQILTMIKYSEIKRNIPYTLLTS